MSGDAISDALRSAKEIAETLARRRIECRMIGASAMAVHGYARATKDIDLATLSLSVQVLHVLAEDLRAQGFIAVVREPDFTDPLGGVIRVNVSVDLEVDIVNLGNPWTREGRRVAELAFSEPAIPLQGLGFSVVGLVPLILLKLSAGSRLDLRDAAELVVRHPELDMAELSRLAIELNLGDELERVLGDARDG